MTFVDILPLFIAFFTSTVILRFLIPFLRKEKMDQTEREELQSHQKKMGTPTMGGIAILSALFIGSIFFAVKEPDIIPVLILTIGFGLIGFIDDFLKVVKHNADGLIAWQKLLLQIALTTVYVLYIVKKSQISLALIVPFTGGKEISIGVFAIILLYIAVIGTVNGTNFTDGLDGLSSSVTIPVALFFAAAAIHQHAGIEVVALAMAGALLGFLMYNCYPAKIFMGDTGSLALGGFVAGMAYMMKMPLFILIVGLIYVIEVISVIIQVLYFKATHGKRFFRMAPIHHHFELGGWSETRVVAVFSGITILLCFIGYAAL
jgi:phospho-N-acetylmuramoyl-pentapeptide-transferase